jgi:hypothetical protein
MATRSANAAARDPGALARRDAAEQLGATRRYPARRATARRGIVRGTARRVPTPRKRRESLSRAESEAAPESHKNKPFISMR